MQPLQRIFALAALILLLTAPVSAGAAWFEAPGRLKPQFSKLLYDPATLRFDKHRNLDIITAGELGGYARDLTTAISKTLGRNQTPLILSVGRDLPLIRKAVP